MNKLQLPWKVFQSTISLKEKRLQKLINIFKMKTWKIFTLLFDLEPPTNLPELLFVDETTLTKSIRHQWEAMLPLFYKQPSIWNTHHYFYKKILNNPHINKRGVHTVPTYPKGFLNASKNGKCILYKILKLKSKSQYKKYKIREAQVHLITHNIMFISNTKLTLLNKPDN